MMWGKESCLEPPVGKSLRVFLVGEGATLDGKPRGKQELEKAVKWQVNLVLRQCKNSFGENKLNSMTQINDFGLFVQKTGNRRRFYGWIESEDPHTAVIYSKR